MSAVSTAAPAASAEAIREHQAESSGHYLQTLRRNRAGLWLFFLSELFLFGGLLVARFYLWGGTRPELDQTIGLIVTVVLLVSSYFMNLGETAMEYGDRKTFLRSFAITFILGTIFLLGVMIFEWGLFPFLYEGHLTPGGSVYGAIVFAMTGMHALHVITGLIFIAVVWNLGRKGQYSPEEHWGVEACAIYWHYVDVVWIFFYPALYLIGTPVH